MRPVCYLLFVTLTGAWACDTAQNEKTALLELFHKEKALNCRLASMKDSITTEWDNVNHLLEESLPADMPEEEKTNMLKVRNANLIRMFQSFALMDEEMKMELKKTEQLDLEMTKRITTLRQEANMIETQKIELLGQINQTEGAEEVARLKRINKTLLSETCK